jgi:hypothetical protein
MQHLWGLLLFESLHHLLLQVVDSPSARLLAILLIAIMSRDNPNY